MLTKVEFDSFVPVMVAFLCAVQPGETATVAVAAESFP